MAGECIPRFKNLGQLLKNLGQSSLFCFSGHGPRTLVYKTYLCLSIFFETDGSSMFHSFNKFMCNFETRCYKVGQNLQMKL